MIGDSCVIGAMVDGNVCVVSAVNDGSCSLRWSDVQESMWWSGNQIRDRHQCSINIHGTFQMQKRFFIFEIGPLYFYVLQNVSFRNFSLKGSTRHHCKNTLLGPLFSRV